MLINIATILYMILAQPAKQETCAIDCPILVKTFILPFIQSLQLIFCFALP